MVNHRPTHHPLVRTLHTIMSLHVARVRCPELEVILYLGAHIVLHNYEKLDHMPSSYNIIHNGSYGKRSSVLCVHSLSHINVGGIQSQLNSGQ